MAIKDRISQWLAEGVFRNLLIRGYMRSDAIGSVPKTYIADGEIITSASVLLATTNSCNMTISYTQPGMFYCISCSSALKGCSVSLREATFDGEHSMAIFETGASIAFLATSSNNILVLGMNGNIRFE